MKYTLEDLVKSYYTDKIHIDLIECDIKLYKLEGKDITDLEKEKDLYTKKVEIVEYYFLEDVEGTAPIRQYLHDTKYKVCECIYFKNITYRKAIAKMLNIHKDYVSTCVSESMRKLREIEVNI